MSRRKKIEDPVLITGAARSRTSMTAGIVSLCGAWGGEMSGPTPYNKKGMFENASIRNDIVKPYLRLLGVDPMCQDPLPDTRRLSPYRGLRDDIVGIITEQGYSSGPWFYKGAKMCLIWPLWHKAFPDAKWIIVRRDKEDIVQSCLKTPFMRKRKGPDSWREWVEHHEECFDQMRKEEELDLMEVDSDKLVDGDLSEMKAIVKWLGLSWREKEVAGFIDPSLTFKTEELPEAEDLKPEPQPEEEVKGTEEEENGL